jgi:hypothetical protein
MREEFIVVQVPRKILGPMRHKVKGGLRKLHNEGRKI